MKVGVLTYHFANNYGASLQVYAMQRFLSANGIDSDIIDFVSRKQNSNNSLFEYHNGVKSIIKNIIRLPHICSRTTRIKKFQTFREKQIILSRHHFNTLGDLDESIIRDYDLIIVGSDQVWNPRTPDFEDIYFKISQLNIPVIAYGASIGNAKIEDFYPYVSYVKRFRRISVRENSTIGLLEQVDRAIVSINVLDPTLLISSEIYENLAEHIERKEKPYIICYYLGRKDYMKAIRTGEIMASRLNKDIYYINASNGLASYKRNMINNAGPEDFVSLIKNSDLVITNSFHATAISIQLGVPFYNFEESGSSDNRKKDLLIRLGIQNRAFIDFEVDDNINLNNSDILAAKAKIPVLARDSKKFLQEIFNNIAIGK